ncbi:MAG TPA: CsiV family protein [Gammaproteobacteria bacterium]
MRFLITVAVVLASLPLHAAEPVEEKTVTWYDVEMIVFRNLDTRSSETWPTDAGVPAVEDALPLFPPPVVDENGEPAAEPEVAASPVDSALPAQAPTPYVPLDESAYRLTGIRDSLARSSHYEPILHVAWTQPPLDREQAPYLRLTLPDALQPEEPLIADDDTVPEEERPLLGRTTDDAGVAEEPLPFDEAPGFLQDADKGPGLARPLDGVVQLSVSRYLHLDLDLIYLPDDFNAAVLGDVPAATREWTEEERLEREQRHRDIIEALARGDITLEEAEILSLEPDTQVFEGFRLDQYRRLRSREIHYFDHPVYSVIVTVTPREVAARTLETGAPMQSPQ